MSAQKGFAHALLLILLLAGLGFGVYLVQTKTNLFSRAGLSGPIYSYIQVNGYSHDGIIEFSWTKPVDAVSFAVRVDRDPNSYDPANLERDELLDDRYSTSYLSLDCAAYHDYRLWVHGVDLEGNLSSEVGEATVICVPGKDTRPMIIGARADKSTIHIQWLNSSNADHFAIRLDKDPGSWNPSAMQQGDVLNDNYYSKELIQSCDPGSKYRFWVHGVSSMGEYSDVDEITVLCREEAKPDFSVNIPGCANKDGIGQGLVCKTSSYDMDNDFNCRYQPNNYYYTDCILPTPAPYRLTPTPTPAPYTNISCPPNHVVYRGTCVYYGSSNGSCGDSNGVTGVGYTCDINSYNSSKDSECRVNSQYPYFYTKCNFPAPAQGRGPTPSPAGTSNTNTINPNYPTGNTNTTTTINNPR